MSFTSNMLDQAFFHILRNEEEVARSQSCCCYQCQSIFPAHSVSEWVDEPEAPHAHEPSNWVLRGARSACCPNCGFDNVVASASGFPVTDENFVAAMHKHHWG